MEAAGRDGYFKQAYKSTAHAQGIIPLHTLIGKQTWKAHGKVGESFQDCNVVGFMRQPA
jgi:hypothetical protein